LELDLRPKKKKDWNLISQVDDACEQFPESTQKMPELRTFCRILKDILYKSPIIIITQ
jgi:hypothetical protein